MKRLLTICLILLLCASTSYATKIADADDSTAIAAVGTDTDALLILSSDILASNKVVGDVFYVNSNATGSATGVDWTNAEVTIEAALANCTAAAGDWIFVAPSHAETGAAAFVDLDKTDVTVWGIGNSTRMPTLSYDTTTDTFIIGAAGDGCTIKNIKFIATVTAVANAIVVEAGCTDFIIEDCVFENETTTTDEFIDAILVSGTASDRGIIRNNRFLGDVGANAGPKSSINFVDCDYLQIIGNEFSGDIGDAHIFNETTASNYITIKDNSIMCGFIGADSTNLDVTPGISLVATTTGWVQDNFVVTNVANPELAIVAADCYLSGNKYSETQGATGSLDIGLEVGKVYVRTMTSTVAATTDQMFTVAGGPIEIISMFGQCTTLMASAPGNLSITIDATDGSDYDNDLTVVVDVDTLGAGDVLTFSNAISEGAGTFVANQNAGQTLSWFCPEGEIEQLTASTGTGAVEYFMTFRPLVPGVTVTSN